MKPERVLKKNAIKAFKAFNRDLTCKGFQYEVGKEYQHKGKLEMCNSGFHACPKLADCFKYYRFSAQETRVAEVLVWGSLDHDDGAGSKLCASNIKIVRELSWHEVTALCNTGASNSGFRNTGDWNSGSWNSGNHNSGNYNSGNRNSGNWNSGNWNSGDWNSGHLNTSAQKYCFIFNKPVEKSVLAQIEFPKFMRFILTEWIPDSKMSRHEKARYPKYATTGGYLKEYDYKTAFRKSFEKAKRLPDWPKQRQKLLDLPNFDAKVFEEISGITPEELGISAKELADKVKTSMEVTMADIEKVFGCKIKLVKER